MEVLHVSVVRYAERTREPLLVEDAAHDDRFTRDPYLTGIACCSLMVASHEGVLDSGPCFEVGREGVTDGSPVVAVFGPG